MLNYTVHPGFLKEQGFCVYEHVFPDGKRYIGISKNAGHRWKKDGHGYDNVPAMKEAIEKTGWDNIQHNIIVQYLPRKQAQVLEQYLIKTLGTIKNGYNQRSGGELAGSLYSKHVTRKLRQLRKCPIEAAREFGNILEMFSENEPAAYLVNVSDYVIRTEIAEYEDDGDTVALATWVYYMKGAISGKDIRKMPSTSIAISNAIDQIEK